MSDDWKPGDLAVCVDDRPCGCCGDPMRLRNGEIYRILAVTVAPYGVALDVGIELTGNHIHDTICNARRFRKIRPDEQAGNREDWALLIETHKQRVSA